MSQLLFHFQLSNTPEISGVFREKRVIFDAPNKPTQDVETTASGEGKTKEISDVSIFTKDAFAELQKKIEGAIDTDEEKTAVSEFSKNLEKKITKEKNIKDDTRDNLKILKGYFDETENQKNIEALRGIHEGILTLIQEDVKYKESIALNETEKSYVEKKIEEWGEDKILEILEKEDENITPKEIKIALGFVLQKSGADLDSEISEETINNLSLNDKFSGKGDKIKAFFEKAQAEAGEKSLYFDSVKGISFKSKKDVLIDAYTSAKESEKSELGKKLKKTFNTEIANASEGKALPLLKKYMEVFPVSQDFALVFSQKDREISFVSDTLDTYLTENFPKNTEKLKKDILDSAKTQASGADPFPENMTFTRKGSVKNIDINTSEGKEKITASNTLEERIQAINKNKKEYRDYVKKDIKKNNSLLGMIFNLFGIDVSDPTQSGSFINFIREQVLNLKTPEEYKPLKDKDGNEKSRSYLLGNDPEIQQKYLKPLLSRISQQQPVPSTKYKSFSDKYSPSIGKKLEGTTITSPTRVMAGDLLSRYPGSRLKYVSGERMKLDISGLNTSEKRQAEIETETIFKNNGGGAMATMKNMVSGLGGELMDSLSNTDLGNVNLGDKLSRFLDSSTENSSSQSELISAEKMAIIRKNNLGFPDITGYDCSNDVITIDFDQTPSSKDKDSKKDKKSTIPESVLGKNPF